MRRRARRQMAGLVVAGLLALVGTSGLAGCATSSGQTQRADSASGDTSRPYGTYNDGPGPTIDVPDVSGQDGADAVSTVEDAGLTATLADENNDPSFDSSRDATGCEVTDQDPAAGDAASEGDEVTITVDCSQVDWEDQEGSKWDAFNEAYSSGFDDGCQGLFDTSPNGSLYEDDVEYTVIDCQNLAPSDASDSSDLPSDVPDDPESAGTDLGTLDGCQALFEEQGVVSLNYGTDSITEGDCPVGMSAPAPSSPNRPKPATGSTTTKHAGGTCLGKKTDGTPLALQVEKGKVNCAGAVALLNEWLRRAPSEGQGSGGVLTISGWECAGATAPEAPRIGSCSRTDGSAAFAAYDGE